MNITRRGAMLAGMTGAGTTRAGARGAAAERLNKVSCEAPPPRSPAEVLALCADDFA